MRRVSLLLGIAIWATAFSACGKSEEDELRALRAQLRTPPPYVAAAPLPSPAPTVDPKMLRDPRPTAKDAKRLRAVIAGWADAVRRGDSGAAGEYFVLPAIVAQPSFGPVQIGDPEVLAAWHKSLPCGAELQGVQGKGRYVIGTFELTQRPGHVCASQGAVVEAGFVFGDPAHPRRFTEWWQVLDSPGEPTYPNARPAAPEASASTFGP